MKKNKLLPLYILVLIFIANILFIDVWLIRSAKISLQKVLSATSSGCPSACVDMIRSKVGGGEQVIPISATGSTNSSDWTVLPGSEITFNKASYAGAKKMYFQASLSSDASDRTVYARLYDATHEIGIQGSDISAKSSTLLFVQSGNINPFSGDLSLKVQIKSLNGNLVTITNPRIRVVY